MNLGLLSPDPNDATSFYRNFGCWAYLSRKYGLTLLANDRWDISTILQCDAIFCQRFFKRDHVAICKLANQANIPIISDYDDNLLDVSNGNAARRIYDAPEIKENIRAMLEMSRAVVVPTNHLGLVMGPANVIPNAFNNYIFKLEDGIGPREKIVSWRGSVHHWHDMEPFIPAIARVAKDFPDWKFHFFGEPHWGINGKEGLPKDQVVMHLYQDNMFSYMNDFIALRPAVHFVALIDDSFNRAKSKISWLEGTHAGAMVVCPDFDEWLVPGAMNYSSVDDFEVQLRNAITMSSVAREERVESSRAYVRSNLLLSNVNERRMEVLTNVVKSARS